MDRRAAFFLAAAAACALLAPVTDSDDRWVPIGLAALYVLLAVASWADRRGRYAHRPAERRR